MKTFTIDTDNNISAFATQEEAAATTTTPTYTSVSSVRFSRTRSIRNCIQLP